MSNIPNIHVEHDKVLIKLLEGVTKTSSGLDIPSTQQDPPAKGEVLAVGKGLKDKPMDIKVGTIVYFQKGTGSEIEHEGEKYLILFDIMCLAWYEKID